MPEDVWLRLPARIVLVLAKHSTLRGRTEWLMVLDGATPTYLGAGTSPLA